MVEHKYLNNNNVKYIFPSTQGLEQINLKENFYSIKMESCTKDQVNHLEVSMYFASNILRSKRSFLLALTDLTLLITTMMFLKQTKKLLINILIV